MSRKQGVLRERSILKWIGMVVLASTLCHPAVAERAHHAVTLGATRSVPYSREGDPAGSNGDENKLAVRPLVVDGHATEWTTGEMHEVTERSFVVRRAIRINDALPDEKVGKNGDWVWQRGPWLLIDRVTGHVTQLRLPDFDPAVSDVVWFRDYAAYCGVTPSGKSLYAVVAQIAVRKPRLSRKLAAFDPEHHLWPVCAEPVWQRNPMRVTFQPTGGAAHSFDLVGSSAVLVEQDDPEPGSAPGGEAGSAPVQVQKSAPSSVSSGAPQSDSAKPTGNVPTGSGPQR
jgi:hypothetical protein